MLHEVTADGGLGFCQAALANLLPFSYHGPLVVALDSNVLIDLQQYGNLLLNDDLPEVDEGYARDLAGLTDLLNLWLLRDIRFVVTPRSRTDARKVTQQFLYRRLPAIDALASSLAFQFGDWTVTAPSYGDAPVAIGDETGLPANADRELVLEAQAVGAHIFLTVTAKSLIVCPFQGQRWQSPRPAFLRPRSSMQECGRSRWDLRRQELPIRRLVPSGPRHGQMGWLAIDFRRRVGGSHTADATNAVDDAIPRIVAARVSSRVPREGWDACSARRS